MRVVAAARAMVWMNAAFWMLAERGGAALQVCHAAAC
jgi:hypothetical protein